MNRRFARLLGAIAAVVLALISCGVVLTELAAAQTTTIPPATTSPTTTAPAPTSTAPATTSAPPTTPPTTATTGGPTTTTENNDSGDDTPWALIAGAVVLAAAIVGAVVAWSRRRGKRQQATLDWRRRAASVASETSATARLLAGGTPADAGIDQQLHGTLRTFEDLLQSAPDDATRESAQHALDAVRELRIAVDADASARNAQPPFPPAQVAAAAAGLRSAASEADRTLRAVYNGLTETA